MKKSAALLLALLQLISACAHGESLRDEAHRYSFAGPFADGFTWAYLPDEEIEDVVNEGQGYIIDTHGSRLTDDSFAISTRYFHEGLVTVWKEDKAGCIDQTGQTVIPFVWSDIDSFVDGLAIVQDENHRYGLINRQNELLIPCEFSQLSYYSLDGHPLLIAWTQADGETRQGILSPSGEAILPFIYDGIYPYTGFAEGMLLVKNAQGYGFLRADGSTAVPCQYDLAMAFGEGLAAVYRKETDQFSFIDETGEIQFSLPAGWIVKPGILWSGFQEGLAVVQNADGLYGYIDTAGALALPCQWDFAQRFSGGLAVVAQSGQYGCIDRTGKEILPCRWDYVEPAGSGGERFIVEKDGISYLIDAQESILLSGKLISFYPGGDNLFVYSFDPSGQGKFGLANGDGEIICPCQWDYIYSIMEEDGLIEVVQGDMDEYPSQAKCGYINQNGETVIPCEYDNCYYSEGIFTLIQDDYLTILDKEGNVLF